MMAVIFGLFFGIKANSNSAVGIVLLLALTGFMGLMLGPILQVALHLRNGAQLIGLAAGGTGIIFLTLAGIATTTKKDFSFMGNFLMVRHHLADCRFAGQSVLPDSGSSVGVIRRSGAAILGLHPV